MLPDIHHEKYGNTILVIKALIIGKLLVPVYFTTYNCLEY